MRTSRLLLIIDPQIDFISGSLPVEGAAEAMDRLADYLDKAKDNYDYCVVTTDWHPFSHCSFDTQGGQWPVHCVKNTVGAAIYPALIAPLFGRDVPAEVLRKGVYPHIEEYSIFKNTASAQRLQHLVRTLDIDTIDICGIAGDVCVLDTLKDGLACLGNIFRVLTAFCPSLDGGKALSDFIQQNNIAHD